MQEEAGHSTAFPKLLALSSAPRRPLFNHAHAYTGTHALALQTLRALACSGVDCK